MTSVITAERICVIELDSMLDTLSTSLVRRLISWPWGVESKYRSGSTCSLSNKSVRMTRTVCCATRTSISCWNRDSSVPARYSPPSFRSSSIRRAFASPVETYRIAPPPAVATAKFASENTKPSVISLPASFFSPSLFRRADRNRPFETYTPNTPAAISAGLRLVAAFSASIRLPETRGVSSEVTVEPISARMAAISGRRTLVR